MNNITILKKIQCNLIRFDQEKELNFSPVNITSDFHCGYVCINVSISVCIAVYIWGQAVGKFANLYC